MYRLLQILSIGLVAVTMGLALAHALEFPGKRRLDEEGYRRTQAIYYPGFTLGGAFGEFGGMVAVLVLFAATPAGPRWWPIALALLLLIVAHLVYWLITHPVNKEWLHGQKLGRAGTSFFSVGGARRAPEAPWTALRDRWEYSHAARAVLAMVALLLLVLAATGPAETTLLSSELHPNSNQPLTPDEYQIRQYLQGPIRSQ